MKAGSLDFSKKKQEPKGKAKCWNKTIDHQALPPLSLMEGPSQQQDPTVTESSLCSVFHFIDAFLSSEGHVTGRPEGSAPAWDDTWNTPSFLSLSFEGEKEAASYLGFTPPRD